jgi:hypothetical protein
LPEASFEAVESLEDMGFTGRIFKFSYFFLFFSPSTDQNGWAVRSCPSLILVADSLANFGG